MKHLGLILLVAAGIVLGAIAWLAPKQEEGRLAVAKEGVHVPTALSGAVPAGYVVRTLAVENMCKDCCPPKVFEAIHVLHEVEEAAVDMDKGLAQVVVPADFDAARIADVLTKHAYPAHVLP